MESRQRPDPQLALENLLDKKYRPLHSRMAPAFGIRVGLTVDF